MGEPKALLALALSPPNLDDIERTILSLKEVCDLYGNSLLPCMLYLVTVLLKLVLKEAETNRSLVQMIRKQKATFFGHVMRKEGLEHFLTTGKLDRKRSKRRQREKMLDSLKSKLGAGRVMDMMLAATFGKTWLPTPWGRALDDDDC